MKTIVSMISSRVQNKIETSNTTRPLQKVYKTLHFQDREAPSRANPLQHIMQDGFRANSKIIQNSKIAKIKAIKIKDWANFANPHNPKETQIKLMVTGCLTYLTLRNRRFFQIFLYLVDIKDYKR